MKKHYNHYYSFFVIHFSFFINFSFFITSRNDFFDKLSPRLM